MTAPLDDLPSSHSSSAKRPSTDEILAAVLEMCDSMVTPHVVEAISTRAPKLERHLIAVALALPRGELYEALLVDMRKVGQRVPIVTYQGKILDGWDRYCACLELGLIPIFQEYIGSEPLAEFFRLNVLRRHLPKAQLAAIVFRNTDPDLQAKHGGRRDQAATLPLATVRSQALLAGCSEKTQREVNKLGRESSEAARLMAEEGLTIAAAKAIAIPEVAVKRKSEDSSAQLTELRIGLRTSAMAALNDAHPESARMPDDTWALYLSQLVDYEREISELQFVVSLLKARLFDYEPAAVTREHSKKLEAGVRHESRREPILPGGTRTDRQGSGKMLSASRACLSEDEGLLKLIRRSEESPRSEAYDRTSWRSTRFSCARGRRILLVRARASARRRTTTDPRRMNRDPRKPPHADERPKEEKPTQEMASRRPTWRPSSSTSKRRPSTGPLKPEPS